MRPFSKQPRAKVRRAPHLALIHQNLYVLNFENGNRVSQKVQVDSNLLDAHPQIRGFPFSKFTSQIFVSEVLFNSVLKGSVLFNSVSKGSLSVTKDK